MQGQEAKVGPPYSPDIAKLEGVQFEDNNTVTSYVQEWVCTESKKLLEKGMKQLQKWWKKCLEANGDYFAGNYSPIHILTTLQ